MVSWTAVLILSFVTIRCRRGGCSLRIHGRDDGSVGCLDPQFVDLPDHAAAPVAAPLPPNYISAGISMVPFR
jgi:hypothetical protein